MRHFIKTMLSSSSEISHKRFMASGAFIVLVGMVVAKGFGIPLDTNLIYVFAGLAGGQSILTMLESKK